MAASDANRPAVERAIVAVFRIVFDSRPGYALLIVAAILVGWFGARHPWLLWTAGGLFGLLVVSRVTVALLAWRRGSGGRRALTQPRWLFTPLADADGSRPAGQPGRFTRPTLRTVLEARTGGGVFIPVYGKTFELSFDPDEFPDPPSAKTVRIVNELVAWTQAHRHRIRDLLVADALAAVAEADPGAYGDPARPWGVDVDSVESLINGGSIGICESTGVKSRLATLYLHAPWGHEGGLEVVIRDGEPIDIGGRYMELEAYDAAYE